MRKNLVDHLICPSCLPAEKELVLQATKVNGDDIYQGQLSCGRCGREYPIQDGLADLDLGRQHRGQSGSKYETPNVLSSYLWSHFGDLLEDDMAPDAYTRWAALIQPHGGWCLDIGAAVGRFSFEMAAKCDFVVGLDNSVAFIQTARELMQYRQKDMALADEGRLATTAYLAFPVEWRTDNIEFIVADAQALPFRSSRFSSVTTLNMVDKLPRPIDHLRESNRVAADSGAQFLLSDPFSWSTETTDEDNWLGGLDSGLFAGRGLDNIASLLQDDRRDMAPAWSIDEQGQVWWKIRTHSNHFELIRSCFVKAHR